MKWETPPPGLEEAVEAMEEEKEGEVREGAELGGGEGEEEEKVEVEDGEGGEGLLEEVEEGGEDEEVEEEGEALSSREGRQR